MKTKAAARVLLGEDDVKLSWGLTWEGDPGHWHMLGPQ